MDNLSRGNYTPMYSTFSWLAVHATAAAFT